MLQSLRNGKWTGFLFLLTYVGFLGGAVLINRVLPLFSFWGMIGYPITAIGGIMEAFGIHMGTYLALPIALYELVFAVYLLINGYGSSYRTTTKGEER
ncbi:MAG: hypothetical protein JXA95_04155 [Spirochaetales bacterium]|nr:hypothetical protein [Spirochaetales bacterium]